jgi:integrase
MSRQKILILPRLHTYDGDVTKQWFVYYSYRDPSSGKMKRFRIYDGFSKHRSAAEKMQHGHDLLESLKEKLLNGWSPFEDRSKVVYADDLVYRAVANKYGRMRSDIKTFNYFINEFLKNHTGIRPSTYATYKSKFRYFQEFLTGQKLQDNSLKAFGKKEAAEFNVYLKFTRKLSAKSINQYNVLMRTFYKFLIKNGEVSSSPFDGIKTLKVETKKPRVYSSQYLHKVTGWAGQYDKQLLLVIRIIFNCLIRPGEIRKIRIRDVDLVNGKITVSSLVAKTGKQRVVDIPEYLVEEMKSIRIDQHPEHCFLIGYNGVPGLRMIGKNNLYNRFVRMRKATKIPREFILYAFKHTGMVELKRSGADWLEIKNQVGHQSLDQVIEYMTELMGESSEHIKKRGPRI